MQRMDVLAAIRDLLSDQVVVFVLGGLFTAALGEWRARVAENRARSQRQEEWDRDQTAATRARLREAVLRDIDETRRFFVEQETYLLARSEGRVVKYPGAKYPNLDIGLLGDPRIGLELVAVAHALLQLPPGAGVPMPLLQRAGLLHVSVIRALRNQEARARGDQHLLEMTEDDLRSVAADYEALSAKVIGEASPSGA
jgi:hypothetical protein